MEFDGCEFSEEPQPFDLNPTVEFQLRYPIFWSVFGQYDEVCDFDTESQSNSSDIDIIALMDNLEI